jgi:leucine-rich PPR motif-containing protein
LLVDLPSAARTELLAKNLALLRAVPGVKFDISHYNAILKVHMENGNNVVASDFLAELEEAGMEPNRVTFQHLVGLYCNAGNVAGATTVLEHMKEQDMAISEHVFLGLLSAHCLNLDHASVASTLEVMAASGLLVGPQAHALLAASYGRAGAWDQVVQALDRAKAEDVHLDDVDIFNVMIGCCRGGLQEKAGELMGRLPKKAGYFQKMRNAVPQIVHAGGVRLATDIFLDTPARRASEPWQGKFLLAVRVTTF